MAIPARLTLYLVVVVLAACSTMERRIGPAAATPCNSGVCQVYVEVLSCASDGLRITPEHIGVEGPQSIQWTIATEGYKFPPDGIAPSDGIVITGSGFTRRPGVTGNGKRFIVHDDWSDKTPAIKYNVHVVKQNGNDCARYDPFISNL